MSHGKIKLMCFFHGSWAMGKNKIMFFHGSGVMEPIKSCFSHGSWVMKKKTCFVSIAHESWNKNYHALLFFHGSWVMEKIKSYLSMAHESWQNWNHALLFTINWWGAVLSIHVGSFHAACRSFFPQVLHETSVADECLNALHLELFFGLHWSTSSGLQQLHWNSSQLEPENITLTVHSVIIIVCLRRCLSPESGGGQFAFVFGICVWD